MCCVFVCMGACVSAEWQGSRVGLFSHLFSHLFSFFLLFLFSSLPPPSRPPPALPFLLLLLRCSSGAAQHVSRGFRRVNSLAASHLHGQFMHVMLARSAATHAPPTRHPRQIVRPPAKKRPRTHNMHGSASGATRDSRIHARASENASWMHDDHDPRSELEAGCAQRHARSAPQRPESTRRSLGAFPCAPLEAPCPPAEYADTLHERGSGDGFGNDLSLLTFITRILILP